MIFYIGLSITNSIEDNECVGAATTPVQTSRTPSRSAQGLDGLQGVNGLAKEAKEGPEPVFVTYDFPGTNDLFRVGWELDDIKLLEKKTVTGLTRTD